MCVCSSFIKMFFLFNHYFNNSCKHRNALVPRAVSRCIVTIFRPFLCEKLRWPRWRDCLGPRTRKVRLGFEPPLTSMEYEKGTFLRHHLFFSFLFFPPPVQELEKEGAKAIATQSEEPIRYDLDEEALCKPLCPNLDKDRPTTTHKPMRTHHA